MRRNKKIAAVAAGALVLGSAGVAYAYWTTSGSTTGSGTTEAGATELVLEQTSDIDEMFPGDTAQPLTVSVTNPGPAAYSVSSVVAYLTVEKAEGAPAGDCDSTDYLLNGVAGADDSNAQPMGWTARELTAGEQHDATGSIQFNNKTADNQDACKGAVVTVHYLAS